MPELRIDRVGPTLFDPVRPRRLWPGSAGRSSSRIVRGRSAHGPPRIASPAQLDSRDRASCRAIHAWSYASIFSRKLVLSSFSPWTGKNV